VDYHFVSEKEMADLVESGQMLETNVFLGNIYGTSKLQLRQLYRMLMPHLS